MFNSRYSTVFTLVTVRTYYITIRLCSAMSFKAISKFNIHVHIQITTFHIKMRKVKIRLSQFNPCVDILNLELYTHVESRRQGGEAEWVVGGEGVYQGDVYLVR